MSEDNRLVLPKIALWEEKKQKAFALLTEGKSRQEAAKALEVEEGTLQGWMREDEFRGALLAASLIKLCEAAPRVVRELLRIATESHNQDVRRKACVDILRGAGVLKEKTGSVSIFNVAASSGIIASMSDKQLEDYILQSAPTVVNRLTATAKQEKKEDGKGSA